jgi:hypothetical protein
MKLFAKLAKLKQQRKSNRAGPKPGSHERKRLAPSTWVLVALCLVLAGLGTLAVFEFFVWNKIPPELVGMWEVQEGPQKYGTFEFSRNGTMDVRLKTNKRDVTHKTRVAVRDRTLLMTAKDPQTREDKTSASIIRELTADTLILELERGDVLRMVRVE